MFRVSSTLEDYVIDINFHSLAYQWLEDSSHKLLVCCSHIFSAQMTWLTNKTTLEMWWKSFSPHLVGILESRGIQRKHQGRKTSRAWLSSWWSNQFKVMGSYLSSKHLSGLCNWHILSIYLISCGPPQHWLTSLGRWPPWWILPLVVFQFPFVWFFNDPNGNDGFFSI